MPSSPLEILLDFFMNFQPSVQNSKKKNVYSTKWKSVEGRFRGKSTSQEGKGAEVRGRKTRKMRKKTLKIGKCFRGGGGGKECGTNGGLSHAF